MNQKEAISKVVRYLTEVDSIQEQIKDVLDAAKESELDPAIIKAVASAVVKANVDKLQTKSESILEAIEEYRS